MEPFEKKVDIEANDIQKAINRNISLEGPSSFTQDLNNPTYESSLGGS